MSVSNTGSDPELFAEAPLPSPLEALVVELGVQMKPLVVGAGQRSHTFVQCPSGAQMIKEIYKQYHEIVETRADSVTRLLARLGVNARAPPNLLVLQQGITTITPDNESAIIIPTFVAGADNSFKINIVEKKKQARYAAEWRLGSSYCLSGAASIEVLGASKVGVIVWKVSKRGKD